MNRVMASERRCFGYRSETTEIAGAMPPASPTATDMRASSSTQKVCAMPQAMVAIDHSAQHTAMILRRLLRSASLPTGTPSPAYSSAKARPVSKPMTVSETPNSRLIGSIRMATTCRSICEKTYTSASSARLRWVRADTRGGVDLCIGIIRLTRLTCEKTVVLWSRRHRAAASSFWTTLQDRSRNTVHMFAAEVKPGDEMSAARHPFRASRAPVIRMEHDAWTLGSTPTSR